MIRTVISSLRWLFSPIAVIFIGWFAWQSRHDLLILVQDASVAGLLSACALWILAHHLIPLLSVVVLNNESRSFTYRKALHIYAVNLPAKYIPGGIWHTVGRAAGFHDCGISRSRIIGYVFLENILALGVAAMLGAGGLLLFRENGSWTTPLVFACVLACVMLLALPVLTKHRFLKTQVNLSLSRYIGSLGLTLINWCVIATAFVTYAFAFPISWVTTTSLELGAVYLTSWAVGFVAIFAPQGVGVFEAVSGELLSGSAATASLITLMAGFRLVILVTDIMVWLLWHRPPSSEDQV